LIPVTTSTDRDDGMHKGARVIERPLNTLVLVVRQPFPQQHPNLIPLCPALHLYRHRDGERYLSGNIPILTLERDGSEEQSLFVCRKAPLEG
jgi:hypothetical protein